VYHDHVITGTPGMGNAGTAGEYKAPWKMILLVYNPGYIAAQGQNFQPLKSAAGAASLRAAPLFRPDHRAAAGPLNTNQRGTHRATFSALLDDESLGWNARLQFLVPIEHDGHRR
jgi:hypothetical protein